MKVKRCFIKKRCRFSANKYYKTIVRLVNATHRVRMKGNFNILVLN